MKTHATSAKHKKMQPVKSARNHAIGAKHEKTCNLCQACKSIQIMQPVQSIEKHGTGAEHEKTCNQGQVQEIMQPMSSTRKDVTCVKCG